MFAKGVVWWDGVVRGVCKGRGVVGWGSEGCLQRAWCGGRGVCKGRGGTG